jgi:putative transposase
MSEASIVDQELAQQFVDKARAEGVKLTGPGGLLGGLTKRVLEAGLEGEMDAHLGYEKHAVEGRDGGNSRNGTRTKTVITDVGPVTVEVPRDRDGSFEPQIVRKHQRRLGGVDDMVLSLSAKGLTTGEISHTPRRSVWHKRFERHDLCDHRPCVGRARGWQSRPLDAIYPVVFIDAIFVKIRDGQVANRPIYVAIGVTVDGERDILGLWAGQGGEGAKYWLTVLTEIKNRGVNDVCIVCCDGLKGLPDSIATTWPRAITQTCVLHLIRHTFRLAGRHDWEAIAKALRPIYTAPTEAAARERFGEFSSVWGTKYPGIIRLWDNA